MASWLPLPDVDALPEIDGLIATSAAATASTAGRFARLVDRGAPPPSPARARPHDAGAWFPLPVPDELPSIDELLTQVPWEARPSPARAEPHDPDAWLPLPDVGALPPAESLVIPRTRPRGMRMRTVLVALLAAGTLVVASLGLGRLTHTGSTVEVRADGRRVTVDTGASTVGELLRAQGVRLGPFDRVVPPRHATVRDGLTVTVLRAFPITRDLDGDVQTVYTTYASPSDYLRRDLRAPANVVIRSAPRRLQADSTIILRTMRTGRLLIDSETVDYAVPALDLAELLAHYSVELGPEDYVVDRAGRVVDRDARLVDGDQYSVIRVGRELVRVTEVYSLPDERRPDHSLAVGESRVELGSPGLMSVTYEVTHRNGEEVDRRTVSRVPTVLARPTVTYYGTKADPMWDRIAQCETGGNWGMRGELFSGGLGFYNGTWDAFGGRDFAPNAGLATREEQIIVAERIRASVGIGGWGCARILGYVR